MKTSLKNPPLWGTKLKEKFDQVLVGKMWKQLLLLFSVTVFSFFLVFLLSLCFDADYTILGENGDSDDNGDYGISNKNSIWHNALSAFIRFANGSDMTNLHNGASTIFIITIGLVGNIILLGILISTISNIIDRRIDRLNEGDVTYNFLNHYVILGYNKMAISLIKELYKKEKDKNIKRDCYWFVLQTDKNADEVRHDIKSMIEDNIDKHLLIVHGGRASEEDVLRLHIENAQAIYLLGEENEYGHDSINLDSLAVCDAILEKHGAGEKNVHLNIDEISAFSTFQKFNLFPNVNNNRYDRLNIIPFNFYDKWAERVCTREPYCSADNKWAILDRDGINKDSEQNVHLVIMGLNRMGTALAIEAARVCHFPNFLSKRKRTKITFIDKDARTKMDTFVRQYKELMALVPYLYRDYNGKHINKSGQYFIDVEFEFIEANVDSEGVFNDLQLWGNANAEGKEYLTIAICFGNPEFTLRTAICLPENVLYGNVPILLRQHFATTMVDTMKKSPRYSMFYAFGMPAECLDLDESYLDDAKYINMLYNFYFYCNKDTTVTKSDLDNANMDKMNELWKAIKEQTVNQWSNIYNAHTREYKRRSFDYLKDVTDPDWELLSEVEQNRWNVERLIIGFLPTKGEKDNDQLKHPALVEYEKLSETHKNTNRKLMKYLLRK